MTLKISTARGTVTADGTGAFRQDEGRLAMAVHAGGKTVPLHEIYSRSAGDVILYLHSPAFSRQLPKGKTWVKLDLTKAARAQGSTLGSLQSGTENPSATLQMLKDVASVKKVGSEQIRGVQTTHYHAAIDLKKLAADDPQAGNGLGQLQSQTGLKTIPMDVWIDGDNHVRRLQMSLSIPSPRAGKLHLSLTVNMSGFGSPLTVTLPPASKTTDLTSQASKTTTA